MLDEVGQRHQRQTGEKPRKLTFKEARELEGMEAAIMACEARLAEIEAMFSDPDFNRKYGAQGQALHEEVEAERRRHETLFARWEELEAVNAVS